MLDDWCTSFDRFQSWSLPLWVETARFWASRIKPRHHLALRHPVRRQRIALEPQQAHALGLLPSQDALDDGRLEQRQAQQFVDRRVVQAFALGDLAVDASSKLSQVSR